MKSGQLDRRITIERAVYSTNLFNEKVATWSELITVWASKRDVGDGERIQAQQVSAHISSRFQFRWSALAATVNPTDRLIYEGKIYEIFSCKELGFHDGIEVTTAARSEPASTESTGITQTQEDGGQGEAAAQGTTIISGAGSAGGQGG